MGSFVIPQVFPFSYGGIYEYWSPETYSDILTDSNPTLQIEFDDYESQVKIDYLETNSTPIDIFGYSESNQSIIQIHDVTQLVNESLVIDTQVREKWFLNITKQSVSVEVSLTIRTRRLLAIDIMVGYPLSPFLLFVITLIYAIRELYKLDRDCGTQIGRKLWDKNRGPLLIILLMIIGGGMLTPFIAGYINGDFELVEHDETTERSFSFSLNESVDSIRLDLIEGNTYRFEIQSFTPQNSSLGFILHRSEKVQQLGWVNLTEPILWGIEIHHADNSILALELVRIDNEVNIEVALEIQRIWLAPEVDIMIPVVLMVTGCILGVYAFVITRRIHYALRQDEVN